MGKFLEGESSALFVVPSALTVLQSYVFGMSVETNKLDCIFDL